MLHYMHSHFGLKGELYWSWTWVEDSRNKTRVIIITIPGKQLSCTSSKSILSMIDLVWKCFWKCVTKYLKIFFQWLMLIWDIFSLTTITRDRRVGKCCTFNDFWPTWSLQSYKWSPLGFSCLFFACLCFLCFTLIVLHCFSVAIVHSCTFVVSCLKFTIFSWVIGDVCAFTYPTYFLFWVS